MDTITHTLFGLALYGAVKKSDMTRKQKGALLFTTVIGSQIPDIDVISTLWDVSGRYQMWHRGLTHSLFLVPVWAAFIALLVRLFFQHSGWRWFGIALLAVFIHDTSDLFNAWGTGYFEPFSQMRVTFGTIPIVDLVLWALMLAGFLYVRFRRSARISSMAVYRIVWTLMALHFTVQTAQGMLILHQQKTQAPYEQAALSADFVPGMFTVISKKNSVVTLSKGSLWTGFHTVAELPSKDQANLDLLFASNPKSQTLVQWSPFVVVVDDGQRLGVYDPRFYREGQSFLYEFIDRP
ncbi:inner membrane protein [Paenibacillus sp. RC254]|uniref:metal-dependent hydrolase n=1 Tax=unclassified Paenibacillus TaxID=185978 RepID=UPI0024BA9A15|nr:MULTISPECIES: metal-dependent hydrolase [unclassified Paenibacillus]